jgi:hypothetical protein
VKPSTSTSTRLGFDPARLTRMQQKPDARFLVNLIDIYIKYEFYEYRLFFKYKETLGVVLMPSMGIRSTNKKTL